MNEGFDFKLTPKHLFIAGFVFGVLLTGIIGFILVLTKVLPVGAAANQPTPIVDNTGNNQVNNPTDNTQPTDITIAPISSADHIKGSLNAKVAIITFTDTECPFCKTFHNTMEEVLKTYGSKVAWVYRPYPLTQLHSKSTKEAEALECAAELGGNTKYWAYVDKIFSVTPSNNGLDAAQLPIIAKQIGLDQAKFQTCLDSGKYASKIQTAISAANAAGAQGTPYSVVVSGDQKIPINGAVDATQLTQLFDQLLK